MTSRTDDYHCAKCGRYMFSAYTVHMSEAERKKLDKQAASCKECKSAPVPTDSSVCEDCKGSGEGMTVFNGYMDVLTACRTCRGTGSLPPPPAQK